ncbi:catalase [Litoribacter ruber]|uniref:catalase n=1 Tax=Litoribacter ruber TaxID=702568 RepID=UPI001BDA47AF|nr:catalase [Litoribacter ruber]MBT0810825.1 catalase [Litoribacter ruber]
MDNKPKNQPGQEHDYMTTNQGVKINHTDDSLKIGERGPTIMDDHHFREKMMHFDHERIPERVVHARGSAAHGYFQVYESMAPYSKAKFLQDPSKKTPVFVRFSTVVGFKGSADTVRDVRGFATKFYTEEGNYDLVGNNMPVFFIQDAIKFPDLVHSIKPEPDKEIPQAAAAHDSFWDFISLMPESMHMIMWVLSDRGVPRSYSKMEGFGVHTFRFINNEGKSHFIKLHWKPLTDMASLVWDEAQKAAGKDPDFNRRDLWESIEMGNYPEFELCVQMIPEEDEHKFAFDILDATKLWPEELVPLKKVGKMVLDRNPEDFFTETEQVAFHPGHLVSGIDLTNDPLLQGRLFSYLDTQLTRLGGPNFAELPINRPHAKVENNQQDGFMRHHNNHRNAVNYYPNTRADGKPKMAPEDEQGYVHYPQEVSGKKIRGRSEGFKDHYSQATLFYRSMTDIEKKHIVEAAWFELGKVKEMAIRERVVKQFYHIDADMAKQVAEGIGVKPLEQSEVDKIQQEVKAFQENLWSGKENVTDSPSLSMEKVKKADSIKGVKVGILAEKGANVSTVNKLKDWLKEHNADAEVVASQFGVFGDELKVDKSYITTASVLYDSIFIVDGKESIEAMAENGDSIHFVNECYKHCKPIGLIGNASEFLENTSIRKLVQANGEGNWSDKGVVSGKEASDDFFSDYFKALAMQRHWGRSSKNKVPA